MGVRFVAMDGSHLCRRRYWLWWFFFFFLLLLGVEADIGCSVCLRKEILELGYGFV